MLPLATIITYIYSMLSNAVKFTDQEDGVVSLSAKIEWRKVIVCVADNGIGISEKDLPHICERFYRSSEASSYSGSGIGLAIAEEIITNLHEKMWFESKPGEGTKVFFTIQSEGTD